MSEMKATRCTARVVDRSSLMGRTHPCSRNAVQGSSYCRQHEPAVIAARREESMTKYREESKRRVAARRMEIYAKELYEALEGLLAVKACDDAHSNSSIPREVYYERARTALAKARGESPAAQEETL